MIAEKTIREVREEMGLSQQYMASKLGVSRQAYSNMEKHPEQMKVSQARMICAIFGSEYERIFFAKFAS